METYFCWITVLLPSVQDDIISGMARKGYMVGPSSKDGKVISSPPGNDPAGSVVAISVYRQTDRPTAKSIYDDLVQILSDTNNYFYSVIVAAAGEASWVGANFELSKKIDPPAETISVPDKKLN